MSTGENEQALRAALDFLRKASIIVLGLHAYVFCYRAFEEWGFTVEIIKKILLGLGRTGFYDDPHYAKFLALALLILSLLGSKGKKNEKLQAGWIAAFMSIGLLFYFGSILFFYIPLPVTDTAIIYIVTTALGFVLFLTGGARLSRLLKLKMLKDPFNELNETFPQQEELIENEFSVNLPGEYNLRGKRRRMWINIVNPFRGTLVAGSGGAGKSRYVVNEYIRQHISKQFTMFCFDFKFPDLTNIAYNSYLKHRESYKIPPKFYYINFEQLEYTHRCNPLEPSGMYDITDASEAARTILLALNKEWIKKSGEFFTESAINFVTAVLWFLRRYKDGKYCTLPHLIEFMQSDYNDLFPILSTEPECGPYVNVFISAYLNRALEQLEGQIASAKIAMARLASPQLYWVLNGNDFTLDINNPAEPKILCAGNNPLKILTYGAVLSLYTTRLLKLVNQKGKQKCSLLFDEYPTLYAPLQTVLGTGRGNLLSTLIAVQGLDQIRMEYGREQADVIINLCANFLCGQTSGETAKLISERFGRIVQERESVSINRQDTSVSRSTQLDSAVPASRIATLSSGEFVGTVADNPHEPIKLKNFHCKILLNESGINAEEAAYKPLPKVRDVSSIAVQNNYIQIKNDVYNIIDAEIKRIKADKELSKLLFVDPDEE
ncbi:conjugal transfer protein MobC [Chitinophaga sp. YIM B06452]|uniref:conjugal transfer protein MobC n=1 Tax=Chitinophaga sp. YIM B06452 TaxID=3082158 RepID=UPI0031FE6FEA